MEELRLLPLGTSDFAALRLRNQIYVDKSALVYKVASQNGIFLFVRPRRFGKSLLISTFESLFKFGLRDFKDLAIEKLWIEKKIYNVVRLDFSEMRPDFGLKKFRDDLRDRLIDNFSSFGFRYDQAGSSIFKQLSVWLKKQEPNSLVLLVDEYDTPLTSCLNNPELFNSVQVALSDFYAVLKSNDDALRFVFITGIVNFNKGHLFSEVQELSDISLDTEFGELLGFTRGEVEEYFYPYLEAASQVLNLPVSELLKKVIKQYGGFCFERMATEKVLAPWSFLNFLASPRIDLLDYWFESGGKASALMDSLKSDSMRDPEEYGRDKFVSLSSLSGSSSLESLSDLALLTQTGYLTIKAVKYGDTVFLDYPNLEVKKSMGQLYVEHLLTGRSAGQVGAGPIVQVLSEESAEALVHIFNRLFATIDYQRYPVRDEASVRAFTQVYLAGAGLEPKVEHHTAHGRSDLEVKVNNRHWILEFKVSRDQDDLDKKLGEAGEQLKLKGYGNDSSSGNLIKVALVFSLEERKFVRWKEV
ncbi:MAG: AAA family ATPase [Parasutterella sp.]|jgi:hypothetical protein|uniref:AAA family ATPase n=3 Tax=Parasutterella TaxID=577310 RepID=UPI00399991E2